MAKKRKKTSRAKPKTKLRGRAKKVVRKVKKRKSAPRSRTPRTAPVAADPGLNPNPPAADPVEQPNPGGPDPTSSAPADPQPEQQPQEGQQKPAEQAVS
jgi:hypothetical protein